MCRFFTRGECKYRLCKKSHNLLESKIILTCGWLNQMTVQNFQMLCVLKHNERLQQLQEETNREEARKAHRPARGRGRGRPRHRKKDGSQDLLEGKNRERKFDGPRLPFRSTSRPPPQCSNGQLSGDEDNDSSSDSDHGTHSEKRNDNIKKPCHTTRQSRPISKKTCPTAAQIMPQPKLVDGKSGRRLSSSVAGPSKVPGTPSTTLVTSPMGASLKAETALSTDNVSPKLSAASNVTENSSVKSSIIPDQNHNMELGKMTSPLLPGPGNTSPGYLSISKTSLYSTGEISYAAQPKQVSVSGRPLNPPEAGRSKVPSTPSTTPVTSPMGTLPRAETRLSTDNVSPTLSAASNMTGNSSVKSSFIPYQKCMELREMASSLLPGPGNISPGHSSISKTSLYSTGEISYAAQPKQVSVSGRPLNPPEAGRSKVPSTPSTTPVTSPMGTLPRAETRLSTDNVSPTLSAASNVTGNSSVKSSFIPYQKCMELGEMASSLLPGPGNISPGHSSISKTSLYSTGEISYAAQPKQVSVSGRSLNPPEAGASKVQATPSTKLVTSPMRASPKTETSISTYNASPKTSATSNITENLSTKSSSIPDQKQIIEFGKMTSSSVISSSKVFQTSSPTLQTSPTREDSYTAQPKPVSSTVTVQRNSLSRPSNPPSSSSGSFRTDAPSNKLYASVEPMTKSNLPSGNQYTIISSENKAFNLPPKSTNSTASQPLSATTFPLPVPRKASVDITPEICLSNIWKFCRLGGCCPKMHYYLPYRWQEFNGTDWEDLPNMEYIEKAYCDPNMLRYQSVDFQTMKVDTRRLRRLTTPSSVTKPSEYVLTTEWIWYWKDELGTWTKYGQMNIKKVSSSICSSDLETVYLSDPAGIIRFTAGGQNYIINCQEMRQRNVYYQTEKEVRRRPKFLDFEKVKMLKGSTKSAADNLIQNPLLKTVNYPPHWCMKSLPEVGYQKVLVPENSGEFSNIVKMFTTTVSGHVVKKLWRVQNPSLWQVYQWQKDQMKKKKKNMGINVDERQLFHGTDGANVEAICRDNFDWRVCGTNGTLYGQGSYFARDASYSHNYSVPTSAGTRTMFVAHVLVGDFVVGDSKMRRPPQKYNKTESYDSCVDTTHAPSIFVVFEKFQVYPEYILEYEEEKKSSCVIS
ncbi:uncharacterized protein [Aquarana catesbeiana]